MALIEVDELGTLEATDVTTTSEILVKGKKADELKLERVTTGVPSPKAYLTAQDVKPAVMPTFAQRLWGGICTNIITIIVTTIGGVSVIAIAAFLKLS